MSGGAIRQAVILAGGKGTRLGEITRKVPKPMLPIADRPFLDYLIEMIERHGYEDILLLGGYLGEVLEATYDGRRIGGATIRVMRERAPLGTAGALTVAGDALDPRFLMMNGDAFFDINLRALEQASDQNGAMATLALRSVENAARYGRVIEDKGKIVAFVEKDARREGPGIINGGIYVLKREILDLVRALPSSLERDVFPGLVERGEIRGQEFEGYFLDIGLPETLEQGRRELPKVRLRPAAVFDRSALITLAEGDPEAFHWTEGAVEAIRALNDRGYYVLVTNDPQRGARATLVADDSRRLNAATQERLAAEGAHVD
ncbi:MAG TPA: sugar phosphate nucleotidyltransferase, partial [Roseiarcus sp.]|nr:sugar phosphate nucleotidyltransferase [Roseiarcus sp.]